MGLHYSLFIWVAMLVVSISSLTVNSQVQGCSLVGIDLQHCLVPSTKTPFPLDSCCTSLNEAVEEGYYCLCSLLGSSNYPALSTALALSFSNCYISVPPLTHCHVLEPHPIVITPPVAAVPQLNRPPPQQPPIPLLPPDLPLPPKVNEMPLNSRGDNSSTADRNPGLSSSPLPKLTMPESWDHVSSNGANAKMVLLARNLLIVVAFCAYISGGHKCFVPLL